MSVNKTKPTKDGRCWIFQKKYVNLFGEKKNYSSAHYKTKKEAKDAEALFELSFIDKANYNDMTFLDLYNKYVEVQKSKVKQTTMHSYYKRWDYIKIFEKVRLCDFKESHYQLFRKDLISKKLSDTYRNDIQKFLKILLNFATKWYGMDFRNVYNKFTSFNSRAVSSIGVVSFINTNLSISKEISFILIILFFLDLNKILLTLAINSLVLKGLVI